MVASLRRLGGLFTNPAAVAMVAAGAAVTVLHLVALGTAPPGLYNDEASVGYNAWAIAHHGVDEHGVGFPLYFQAFGEYKDPLYIYTLAPFTWVLPLTAYTTRLPSALFGLATIGLLGLIAWRLTRSHAVTTLMVLTAGLVPWLFGESRLAFQASSLVFCTVLALWCVVHAVENGSWRWFAGAGFALGLSVYSYGPARLWVAMSTVVLLLSFGVSDRRFRYWWTSLVGIVVSYGVLLQWSQRHTGALLARFEGVSITYGDASIPTIVWRFVGNYLQYTGLPFLFTEGDYRSPRNSTGYGGMLFLMLLPVLVMGLVTCVRHWRQPLSRLALLGLITAPVPAALTAEATPQSLRASLSLPFLLLVMVYGWEALWPLLRSGRSWMVAAAAVASIEGGGYLVDLFVAYPDRSAVAFDSGEGDAIVRAHDAAAGHTLLVSSSLDQPYIQALFRLQPDPSAYAEQGLAVLQMRVTAPADMAASSAPGDVLLLAPGDLPPSGSSVLFDQTLTLTRHTAQVGLPDQRTVVVATAYHR
jgi:hypothetical protein